MEIFNVTPRNSPDTDRAYLRQNDLLQHLPVVPQAASPLVCLGIALKEIVRKIVHRWFALRLDALLQRVDAIENFSAQLNGSLARRKGGEVRMAPDGVTTLAALDAIVQNERNRAVAGDTCTEAGISASY